jgi:hypothetical protein
MNVFQTFAQLSRVLLPVLAAATLAGCERPPIAAVQTGYRGTAMDQIYNHQRRRRRPALTARRQKTCTKTSRCWVT